MKAKTIARLLQSKFNAFLESITDPKVKALVKENTIISGGCIVSMLQQQNVNDYDMYFCNEETTMAVANYYAKQFMARSPELTVEATNTNGRISISVNKSKNESVAAIPEPDTEDQEFDQTPIEEAGKKEDATTPRYAPIFLSSNAITLSTKVQLTIRFYGEPEEIHENYDFIHCTSYWTSRDSKLVLRPEALAAILTKELRYVGSKYPICSLIRTRKFLARGFTINAGQFVKMAWQISKLDLTNLDVLKDQLVGVDSTYFYRLIAELEKIQTPFTDSDLLTLIDQIF